MPAKRKARTLPDHAGKAVAWEDTRLPEVEYLYRVNMPDPMSGWASIAKAAESITLALLFIPYNELGKTVRYRSRKLDIDDPEKRLVRMIPGLRIRYFSTAKNPEKVLPTLVVHGKGKLDIFLEDYLSKSRREFTLMHELGHYLLHAKKGKVPSIYPKLSSGSHDREATIFAGYVCLGKEKMEQVRTDVQESILGGARIVSKIYRDCRYVPPGPVEYKPKKRRKKWRT